MKAVQLAYQFWFHINDGQGLILSKYDIALKYRLACKCGLPQKIGTNGTSTAGSTVIE